MASLVGWSAWLGSESTARADNVSPDGKGIVGGGLLGAEVVTIVEGIADVSSGWAYGIGAIVGAGGGAVGGYFVEQKSTDGKVPMYLLAGGLALVIPAVVLTLNGTRYRPERGATDDNVPPTGPAAEPGAPGGSVVAPPTMSPPSARPTSSAVPVSPTAPTRAYAPRESPSGAPASTARGLPSLVDVQDGALSLTVPAVDVRPVFSLNEQRQYGMRAQTEVHLPVLRVAF